MLFSCQKNLEINIVSPERGSIFDKNDQVPIYITTFGGKIFINNVNTGKSFEYSANLPPKQGLVFIKASKPGEDLFDVVSYLQGDLRNSENFLSQAVKANLGENIINNEEVSFASLTSDLMQGEELVSFVENPIIINTEIAYVPVTIVVNVTSVVSSDIDVNLKFENEKLKFSSVLHNVNIEYTSDSSGLKSSGMAFYEQMNVSGELVLNLKDVDLINIKASASEPEIHDNGGIPDVVFSLFSDDLNEKVKEAIAVTTKNASKSVFHTLMTKLIPKISLEFDKPIEQFTETEQINTTTNAVNLSYKTKVYAKNPQKKIDNHKFLITENDYLTSSKDMTLSFGSNLVNQIAFAMWNAGNTDNITYTKDELIALGMDKPSGFYSKFEKTVINLLLPPVLEWENQTPYLAMGGIEMKIFLDGGDSITARTASKVPVKLLFDEDYVMLEMNESKKIQIYDISYNKTNTLLKTNKTNHLLATAMPGVVKDLFGKFPIVKMTSVKLPKLNFNDYINLSTKVTKMETHDQHWIMHLSFYKK